MGWGRRWEAGSGWGTHVNPWLIHVNVWQKPLQYCKVISLQLIKIMGWGEDFPRGLDGKVSVYKCGRPGVDPWVGKIPWRRKQQPIPVFLTRKSHGWRSLVQATVHGLAKSWARLSYFPSFPSFID